MSKEIPLPTRLRHEIVAKYNEVNARNPMTPEWESYNIIDGLLTYVTSFKPDLAARTLAELYGSHINASGLEILDALKRLLVECRYQLPPEVLEVRTNWAEHLDRIEESLKSERS